PGTRRQGTSVGRRSFHPGTHGRSCVRDPGWSDALTRSRHSRLPDGQDVQGRLVTEAPLASCKPDDAGTAAAVGEMTADVGGGGCDRMAEPSAAPMTNPRPRATMHAPDTPTRTRVLRRGITIRVPSLSVGRI